MALAGLWAGKVPGLVAIDIPDFGRRYIISDRPAAWFAGLLSHEINSILLTFFWAAIILPNIPGARHLTALGWGCFLAVTFAGSLVAPLAGLGVFARKTGSPRYVLTSIVLHSIWGILIGALYVPR
jgi:hypothetical protein